MNLIISTFLIFFAHNAAGLTNADEALLKSAGILNKSVLLHDDTWGVKPSEIDVDSNQFKGQAKSLINWKELNHDSWLNFNTWRDERSKRDKIANWKLKLRQSTYEERFGEIIACIGTCRVFRGPNEIMINASSRIYEGDEVQTLEDSSLWLLSADGTLFRLSAKTSITLNEINFSKRKSLLSMRLNHGHIKSFKRSLGKFKIQNLSETDSAFYPLKILQANREFFSREEYSKLDHFGRQIYLTKNNLGHFSQYNKLNDFLGEKVHSSNIDSELFIASPNATLKVVNMNIDFFYGVNSNSILRVKQSVEGFKLSDKRIATAQLMLRGYVNRERNDLETNTWYDVDSKGKEFSETQLGDEFKILDLLVKRVPTIMLAREILIRKHYKHLLNKVEDPSVFAKKYGYRLWDEEKKKEMSLREKFLFEYTRRVETTNLSSLRKVFKNNPETFDRTYYEFAFQSYINKLKGRYLNRKLIIPELTDTEYYVWVLKYAKK